TWCNRPHGRSIRLPAVTRSHRLLGGGAFTSLKVERLHGQRFETIRDAKDETISWLLWYNRTRMHSTLNYVSPIEFEQNWMEATVKIAA
ncbi:MAG TPA: IS3 family transposase, partial [Terracidiphilus sp.]|nr:IS3 family transposase [Terracidiphilus sp.]